MGIGQSAGKSLAYLIGVFLGDGCVTYSKTKKIYSFRLNTIDKDFADATYKVIKDFGYSCCICGPYQDKRYPKSKPLWQLTGSNQELCLYLKDITSDKTKIPEWILKGSEEEQRQFIIGLMDSEGFVCEGKTPSGFRHYMGFKSCDVWIPEFIKLLQKFGLLIGKVSSEVPRKKGYKIPTRFHIKLKSWHDNDMYFNIARKNERVDRWKKLRLSSTTNTLDPQEVG